MGWSPAKAVIPAFTGRTRDREHEQGRGNVSDAGVEARDDLAGPKEIEVAVLAERNLSVHQGTTPPSITIVCAACSRLALGPSSPLRARAPM